MFVTSMIKLRYFRNLEITAGLSEYLGLAALAHLRSLFCAAHA